MGGTLNLDGGRINLDGGMLNLYGGTLTLGGGTRPPYNPSTVYYHRWAVTSYYSN